jgi:hypothetical protein
MWGLRGTVATPALEQTGAGNLERERRDGSAGRRKPHDSSAASNVLGTVVSTLIGAFLEGCRRGIEGSGAEGEGKLWVARVASDWAGRLMGEGTVGEFCSGRRAGES